MLMTIRAQKVQRYHSIACKFSAFYKAKDYGISLPTYYFLVTFPKPGL